MKNFFTIAILLIVLLGGSVWWSKSMQSDKPYDVTSTCVSHGGLGMHIHPTLKIIVNGEEQPIPANIGIPNAACMRPVHTHDATGMIHIESVEIRDFPLKDFFSVWGKDFRDFGTEVSMTINGVENTDFENYIIRDKDEIVLTYTN